MVALRLKLENVDTLPDGGPTSFEVKGRRTVEIGRNTFLDWTLPDPDRAVSGRHAEIAWRDGAYVITDVSTNGTFMNGSEVRLTEPRRLQTGDRIAIGRYHIRVTVEDDDVPQARPEAPPADPARPGFGGRHTGSSLWDVPDAAPPAPVVARAAEARPVHSDMLDWVADIPVVVPAAPPQAEPAARGPAAPPPPEPAAAWPTLGGNTNPAPNSDWDAPAAPAVQTIPERAAADWVAPQQQATAPAAGAWSEQPQPQQGPAIAADPAPPPPVSAPPVSAPPSAAAASAADARATPFGATSHPFGPGPGPEPRSPAVPPPAPHRAAAPVPQPDLPVANEMPRHPSESGPFTADPALSRRDPPPLPSADAAIAAAAASGDAMRRFVAVLSAELGVPPERLVVLPPEHLGRTLGRFMRRSVEGLHHLLRARSVARGYMRHGAGTSIGEMGNNALKFMPTNAAVEVLIGQPTPAYLDADQTLAESFRELSQHQVAVYSAMQTALQRLLADLEPAAIEAADDGKGGGLLGGAGGRKARLWDAYRTRYTSRAEAHDQGMVDVFMLYFGDAYKRAMEGDSRERPEAAARR